MFDASKTLEIVYQGASYTLDEARQRPELIDTILDAFADPDYLYVPDGNLIERLKDYNQWCVSQKGEDAGKLMEELAVLAFRCLKGYESIKSFQSYGPQLDLVISGSTGAWQALMRYLRVDWNRRTILVECKNLKEKVDDKQFSRVCGILQNVFDKTAELAVFFTRFGATGFPDVNGSSQPTTRQRELRDAQATQIIFHAKTGKYVVVLDHQDLQKLVQTGAFPRILAAKIKSVEEWTGMPIKFNEELKEIDLPPHLLKHTP